MAKKKQELAPDEKLENQDLDIFKVLNAADKKDYSFYDNLTDEQKKKFAFFIMSQWMSAVSSKPEIQQYYTMSVNEYCNKHMFDEKIRNHPKLQWLLLCASSPGIGWFKHQWIPQLSQKITNFKDTADKATIKKYFANIYKDASATDLNEITEIYVEEHKKKVYLAKNYEQLKISDIETLSQLITEDDIIQNERDKGNI